MNNKILEIHPNLEIKLVKNCNPELAVAKLFGGVLGLMPIACFWVEGSTYHPISEMGFVYKNGIVIDATTELWYGKGLCGEGLDSLEETLKGLPHQTVGAWVTKIGDEDPQPFYQEAHPDELEAFLTIEREKRNDETTEELRARSRNSVEWPDAGTQHISIPLQKQP